MIAEVPFPDDDEFEDGDDEFEEVDPEDGDVDEDDASEDDITRHPAQQNHSPSTSGNEQALRVPGQDLPGGGGVLGMQRLVAALREQLGSCRRKCANFEGMPACVKLLSFG